MSIMSLQDLDGSNGLYGSNHVLLDHKSPEVPEPCSVRVTLMCWICCSSLVTARTNSLVTSTRNEAEHMSGHVPSSPHHPYPSYPIFLLVAT